MINIIKSKDKIYPRLQTDGDNTQFAAPYAKQICVGSGLDIGYSEDLNRKWALPNSIPFNLCCNDNDAYNLPYEDMSLSYIYSSHCLAYLPNWVEALDHWTSKLKSNIIQRHGTLFLYLPRYSRESLKRWDRNKRVHYFTGDEIVDYLETNGHYTSIFKSGPDLNNSIMIIAQKEV